MNNNSKDITDLSIEEKRALLAQLLREKVTSPSEFSTIRTKRCNTIIESLGVYLPPKIVSTDEVLRGCKKKLLFPLEEITGIKSRRMAGDEEFSRDLAQKAVITCLAKSKFNPEDIDLVICCNISRYDGPTSFSFEPSTSIKLKKHFNFDNALVFDITNACAGMFTAIEIVDVFIKIGLIQCAMVISGEYITHLTKTAQKEIRSFTDSRLACLTLGDAGVAITLEKSPNDNAGFHNIDMYTLGRYSSLCIAQATDKEHGGAIMLTDSIKQHNVSIKQSTTHAAYFLKQSGWPPEAFQHIIMHQTSETALRDAMRALNSFFKKEICHEGNMIINLAERGNTASTSHFVALWDNILNNRIRSGDKVAFGIAASGLTTGTALYTFDDLPDRLRLMELNKQQAVKMQNKERNTCTLQHDTLKVRIESVGTIPTKQKVKRDTMEFVKIAIENCLKRSSYNRNDIDLLIYTGVYRNGFISEPAIASMIAGELKINDVIKSQEEKKTFAFDVFNGAIGLLNAIHIANQMIRAKKYKTIMIVASEIENNAEIYPEKLCGIKEAGSAMILDAADNESTGFGTFIFKYYTDYINAFTSSYGHENGKAYLYIDKHPDIENYYLKCIPDAVYELIKIEKLDISQVKIIFPPQISSAFLTKLCVKMGVDKAHFVDIAQEGKDFFTSSLAYALQSARDQNLFKNGDIALIVNVGTGIQVGCVTYYF